MTAPRATAKQWRMPACSEELPGDLMMWILIASELACVRRSADCLPGRSRQAPCRIRADQALLNQTAGRDKYHRSVTSGLCAALALHGTRARPARSGAQVVADGSRLGGHLILSSKASSTRAKVFSWHRHREQPIFYVLLLNYRISRPARCGRHRDPGARCVGGYASANIETGVAFWHMVDLVWVLLFPIIYVLR